MKKTLSAIAAICMVLSLSMGTWAGNKRELREFRHRLRVEKRLTNLYKGVTESVIDGIDDPLMHTTLRSMCEACESPGNVDETAFLPEEKTEKRAHELYEAEKKRTCYQDILINHFIIDLSIETLMNSLRDEFMNSARD